MATKSATACWYVCSNRACPRKRCKFSHIHPKEYLKSIGIVKTFKATIPNDYQPDKFRTALLCLQNEVISSLAKLRSLNGKVPVLDHDKESYEKERGKYVIYKFKLLEAENKWHCHFLVSIYDLYIIAFKNSRKQWFKLHTDGNDQIFELLDMKVCHLGYNYCDLEHKTGTSRKDISLGLQPLYLAIDVLSEYHLSYRYPPRASKSIFVVLLTISESIRYPWILHFVSESLDGVKGAKFGEWLDNSVHRQEKENIIGRNYDFCACLINNWRKTSMHYLENSESSESEESGVHWVPARHMGILLRAYKCDIRRHGNKDYLVKTES